MTEYLVPDYFVYYNRPSVVYSDNRQQSTANITEDLSKCLIRENTQKTQQHSALEAANKFPLHVTHGKHLQLQRGHGG